VSHFYGKISQAPGTVRGTILDGIRDSHEQVELIGEASRRGHAGLMKLLMEVFGADFDKLHAGHSILVEIILHGEDVLIHDILSQNAHFKDLTDHAGLNCLIATVIRKDARLLNSMLSKGFSPVSETGKNALSVANDLIFPEECELLLTAGVPLGDLQELRPFWMTEKFMAAGWGVEHEAYVLRCVHGVMKLKFLSRLVIRGACRKDTQNLFAAVELLPLPRALKTYLTWGRFSD